MMTTIAFAALLSSCLAAGAPDEYDPLGPRARGIDEFTAGPADAASARAYDKLMAAGTLAEVQSSSFLWPQRLSKLSRRRLVGRLVEGLPSPRPRDVHDLGDVLVPPDRMRSAKGPRLFNGFSQDILLEGGRCALVLEQLTGRDLPPFGLAESDDPRPLRDLVRRARRQVVMGLDLPVRGGPEAGDPKQDGRVVRAAMQTLAEAIDYSGLNESVGKWAKEMPEVTRKKLLLSLLRGLDDSQENEGLADSQGYFIMWQYIYNNNPGIGLPMEHDIGLVNGRCAWAIERMLGCVLPAFTRDLMANPRELRKRVDRAWVIAIESMDIPDRQWPFLSDRFPDPDPDPGLWKYVPPKGPDPEPPAEPDDPAPAPPARPESPGDAKPTHPPASGVTPTTP